MILELENLTHRYGSESAVDGVSFGLESGELVALLGPSGCGKTTIVQAIAGHVRPTSGEVRLRGTAVTDDPPESRTVGLVFQQTTLFPHLTVDENVGYGLAAQGIDRERRADRVGEYLELVGLEERGEAYPAELSGGQQRRVELARALAPQPDVLILDEPLSGLDRALRERMRGEIARIQHETGVTTLCVTHDQEEAMALADRLVVMNDGSLEGVGTPRSLFESPPNPFVASFLGRSNALTGTVVDRGPPTIEVEGATVELDDASRTGSAGDELTCHVRPKDLSLASRGARNSGPSMTGTVTYVADVGRRFDVSLRLESGAELVVEHTGDPPAIGDDRPIVIDPTALTVFDGSSGNDEPTATIA
ncbi:ABC transporter ATP-binding protein [Natrarchaeobius halalkaliphilus]|uniref:Molybdate/tungstate import ATP-binding protein WtpC n=1 Tax=Natrarchaeobius halalkaliphilus TaxID=1679091 RepID=A0A3N6LJP1_9EURY|nr:ABC transporter ATP-binding protein [Natrarchaeobius halalkaliphilus]RQG86154.1 ABC transporter ATP-binding protein [Natrarchaeobius halalkaliphilus]